MYLISVIFKFIYHFKPFRFQSKDYIFKAMHTESLQSVHEYTQFSPLQNSVGLPLING